MAGAGPVDRRVPGLAWPPSDGPAEPAASTAAALAEALGDVDLVIVENVCSLPLAPAVTAAVTQALTGRAAVLHHHDLPWQRSRFADVDGWPPDDPAWRHVTINDLSRRELAERGIPATTIYNGFDPHPSPGDRARTRARLDLGPATTLALHPVRAIERKGIDRALAASAALDAVYWLTGPAEEGYETELARLLDSFPGRWIHQPTGAFGATLDDAYAAADVVMFPSRWEGFGNPPIEAALRRRPAVVGRYPVADELRGLGFRWFDVDDTDDVRRFLLDPADPANVELLEANAEVARHHLSLDRLADDLDRLLHEMGVA